jgi:hypothetical protein
MPVAAFDLADPVLVIGLLLLAGHMLADFAFQTRHMVQEKPSSPRALASHALEVALVQAAAVLWFSCSVQGVLLVVAIALSHLLVDRAKAVLEARWPMRALLWFFLDQAAHIGVLWLAWRHWPPALLYRGDPEVVGRVALCTAVYAFNLNGGSGLVTALLRGMRPERADPSTPTGPGRMIGILERLLIATLVWRGQWSAVGLVMTAKSVARYKRLEEQEFAEAYLIGTMSSVAVAMASGLLLSALL